MPRAAIGLDVLQAADVAGNLTAQLPLHRKALYRFAQSAFFLGRKVLWACTELNAEAGERRASARPTHTVNSGEAYLETLVFGYGNAGDTHGIMIEWLALSLLVAGIFTNNPEAPAALHGATMRADLFNGRFHLHTSEGLETPDYPRAPSVWIKTHFNTVTDEHFYSVQTHFTGEIRQDDIAALELHAKKSVR